MFRIAVKRKLSGDVTLMEVEAHYIARKAQPGQFIIFRTDEDGERIPLTIAGYDRQKGTITIIFQEVGKSTKKLGMMEEGDEILDFVGPLGRASELDEYKGKRAVVIGGGLGTAIAYPQAKKLSEICSEVHTIIGFRTKSLIILEDEMKRISDRLIVATDDGSNGNKGFVTDKLKELLESGEKYDVCFTVGPLVMMKYVSKLTKEYGIRTIVSMNPIMVDGTGMCGGCRVTVGGEVKFACVDGPDFDGHEVDFDEAMRRQLMYRKEEELSERMYSEKCRLPGMEDR